VQLRLVAHGLSWLLLPLLLLFLQLLKLQKLTHLSPQPMHFGHLLVRKSIFRRRQAGRIGDTPVPRPTLALRQRRDRHAMGLVGPGGPGLRLVMMVTPRDIKARGQNRSWFMGIPLLVGRCLRLLPLGLLQARARWLVGGLLCKRLGAMLLEVLMLQPLKLLLLLFLLLQLLWLLLLLQLLQIELSHYCIWTAR